MGQKNKLKKTNNKKIPQKSIRIIKQLNANLFEGKKKKGSNFKKQL